MKQVVFFIMGVITFINVSAQQTPKTTLKTKVPAPVIKTLLDSFSYAAGINVARNMRDQGISELNTTLMYKAIDDVFKNRAAAMPDVNINNSLQRQLDLFAKNKAIAEKAAGIAYLEANKKNKDVIVLPSGLQYMVIKQGDSLTNRPKLADTVVVNYKGNLVNGTEIDDSFKRGQPQVFTLGGVMKGWTEILQLMPVGAHWKVFIPTELAYGEAGYGKMVPPNAALIFEIILEGIKPATSSENPKN